MNLHSRAGSIHAAAAWLREDLDRADSPGRQALDRSTGLHPKMISWALDTTLGSFTENALIELVEIAKRRRRGFVPPNTFGVILAGNIFTAGARACLLPLLFGSEVRVKSSSSEEVFPRLLKEALARVDPDLAEDFTTYEFDRRNPEALRAFVEPLDVLSVHGSDETIQLIRGQCSARTIFVAHGHGFGAAYVSMNALDSEAPCRAAAQCLAIDIAAYDQLGCLSPHIVFVQNSGAISPTAFAAVLHDAMTEIGVVLPRGILPIDAGAAQIQWRGIAMATGTLLTGATHAIHISGDLGFPASPGYRNITLAACDSITQVAAALNAAGAHLKCLGLDRPTVDADVFSGYFQEETRPSICSLGQMQTPPIDAISDGEPPWAYLRGVERL